MYTCCVLLTRSQEQLIDAVPTPGGWRVIAHHATVNMGPLEKGPMADVLPGTEVRLQITHVGKSARALAVRVEGDLFRSANQIPHITVGVAPGAKPVESNDIVDWIPVKPFHVVGVLQEVS